MAEATTPTKTARPARTRNAAAKPATKATPAKAAAIALEVEEKAATEATPTEKAPTPTNRRIIELIPHPQGHTKSFTKWVYPPSEEGVTGTVYGPLGATEAKVLFVL